MRVTLSATLAGGCGGPGRVSATHQYCYPPTPLLPNQLHTTFALVPDVS